MAKPIRVLLVDDDEDDFFLTREMLRDIPGNGFTLDWVSDFDEALEAMCRAEHDVFLMDYRLGARTGLDLLRDAKCRGCNVPVILLTGQGQRDIDVAAMEAGAFDFLDKSRLDAAQLDRSIRYTLLQKKHADELEERVKERTAELARANEALQREVAERKRAEEALREADRRKDQFLATLAHELRNPLPPIRNALEIMRLTENDPATVESGRAMIDRQLRQMVRLIDDLLDISRITRGKIQLRPERVSLTAVVQSALETSRPLIEARGHTLTVSLPPTPIHLEADPMRLAQVFVNLLNNAAKYTDPGGRIALTAERAAGEVVVRVRDNGIGIEPEALPNIFEIFAQAGRSTDRSQGGLGIGLSLVKALVEMHGGTVAARSDGPGQGAEFAVRLPIGSTSP